MNANSSPTVSITIDQWLAATTSQLAAADIPSARLDSLIMLEDTLKKERTWLLAHLDTSIPNPLLRQLYHLVDRRLTREPLAYIREQRDFYGRTFFVSPDVLIPRPETEIGIELLKSYLGASPARLLEVGTGSGCIAITAALELPSVRVEACDLSPSALLIAQKNNYTHGNLVHFFQSDLLTGTPSMYDCIIANLPYVDPAWELSPETAFEPAIALFQDDNGQALIKKLIAQARPHLHDNGYLLLEADPRQHEAICQYATIHEFDIIEIRGLWLAFKAQPAMSR